MNKLELFDLVFNDGEKFVNFYFNDRRNKVVSYQTIKDNNTIALVSCVDISICSSNQKYKAALITGVCTHPDFRNLGIMQKLLSSTLETLKNQNYDFAILCPKNDNYYKKYGFQSLFKVNKKKIKFQCENDFLLKKASKIDTKLLLTLYNNHCKKVKFYQYLSNDILLDIIDEYEMEGCTLQLVYQKNNAIGWIATDGDKIVMTILPDLSILNNLKQLNDFYYFEPNSNGEKELFQIKYLNNNDKIDTNSICILNRH